MQVIESIGALIFTLGVLITIHEYGHFWVARFCGVKVLRFSVGFGKAIWSWRSEPLSVAAGASIATRSNETEQGTEFVIAALPLGGYVKMLDEREGFVPDDQIHMAFNRKSPWQRMAIAVAGPAANVLLALVAYWALFVIGIPGLKPVVDELNPGSVAYQAGLRQGQQIFEVDGVQVSSMRDVRMQLFDRIGDTGAILISVGAPDSASEVSRNEIRVPIRAWLSGADEPDPVGELGLRYRAAIIGRLVHGEPAIAAGFQTGDRVLEVDGEPVSGWSDWVNEVQARPEVPAEVLVLRDERELLLTVTPRRRELNGNVTGFLGAGLYTPEISQDRLVTDRHSLWHAWLPAGEETWKLTVFTLNALKKMVVGDISVKNLSGPITIAQIAGSTAKSGLQDFVSFIALLSISLAVLNLLPIPVLDGGHILYCAAEILLRRPVPERLQVWGMQIGVFLVVSVMLLAIYNDIVRLILR